jgi:hypothetical protein
VLGYQPHIAVDLVVPALESSFFRQELSLVDEICPETPAVEFLESDYVIFPDEGGNTFEVIRAPGMGDEVFPAMGYIVEAPLRHDPDLDVVAQQL